MRSEYSPRRLKVGKAAQAIGAAVDVQFDGQLHPNFEGAQSTGVEMWRKRSEFSADDMVAPNLEQESVSCEGLCELCLPVFLSVLFLHTSTDCSHSFQCCHIGIGSILLQKSHPRYRIVTPIQLGGGAFASVEQANEIVAKLRELETEQNLIEDLFNRALRTSHSGSDVKLNFRQAERHMPGMVNGEATENTEYMFKMEAYLSTLDLGGKGGEILRAATTEDKDMDDDEVTNIAAIHWNVSALNSALTSCLITTTTDEAGTLVCPVLQVFPGFGLRAWQHRERSRLVNYSDSSWTGNSVRQNTRQDTTRTSQVLSRSQHRKG